MTAKEFPSVVVIGSNGQMGKMLLERARSAGVSARGIDRPLTDGKLGLACEDAALALLCVPANVLRDILPLICSHLSATAVLSDITSVKEYPMMQMQTAWSGAVVGTHPLFGPGVREGDDKPVAITPGKNAQERHIALVENFFSLLGFNSFRTDAQTHDKAMSRIQGMNFITNLAYFALLAQDSDILKFLTPSFHRRLEAAKKTLLQDAQLFSLLFESNPHSHDAVRQYRKMLNVAASGDLDLLYQRAKWWWEEH